MDALTCTCKNCQRSFTVPESKAGGLANCPNCGSLQSIPGADWLFRALVGGALIILMATAAGLWSADLPGFALIFLGIGLAILGIVILAS